MIYKKYIVFGFYDHYPSGGLGDIQDSFETFEQAVEFITPAYDKFGLQTNETPYDNYDIVDRDTWQIVKENQYPNGGNKW